MRPITLTMAGVRTYRREHTIEFGGPGLIAVIGDTGAGKSSILEGLTGALYGACTWDNRGIGELISDRAHTAQLELTFAVAGQTWTVSRSASRNNYPPSRHLLRCHDTGEKITGDRAVTRRVTGLLGLNCKQFLRVVVLPQNRFMELLNSPRTERNPILKGIFRLDELDQVRGTAERLCDTLEPKLAQVRLSRAKLADDPAARHADARARRAGAAAQRRRLEELRAKITAHQQAMRDAESAAAEIRAGLEHLTTARSRAGDVDGTLSTTARSATILDGHAAALAGERARLVRVEARAQAALDSAAAAGEDAATLATTFHAVGMLTERVPALITARRALADRDRELAQQASELRELQTLVQARHQELAGAVSELSRLRAQAGQAQRARDDVWAALTTLADAEDAAAKAGERSDQQSRALATARADARRAAADFAQSVAAAETAESQLHDVRRRNSAAHAAAQCQPGDPCPVCDRPLPESFAPPVSADETAARTRARKLHTTADQLNGSASAAAEKARRAADDLADALADEAARLTALAKAAAAVANHGQAITAAQVLPATDLTSAQDALASAEVAGEPAAIRKAAGQLADSSLDKDGSGPAAREAATTLLAATRTLLSTKLSDLISPLADRADELGRRADDAAAKVDEIREGIAALQAQAAERTKALGHDQRRLADQRAGLVADATRIAEQLKALPPIAADVARAAELTAVPIATLSPATSQPSPANTTSQPSRAKTTSQPSRAKTTSQPSRAKTTGQPGDAEMGSPPEPGFVLLPSRDSDQFAGAFRIASTRVAHAVQQAQALLEDHQRELRKARRSLHEVAESEKLLADDRAEHVTRPVRKVAAALQAVRTRATDLLPKLDRVADNDPGTQPVAAETGPRTGTGGTETGPRTRPGAHATGPRTGTGGAATGPGTWPGGAELPAIPDTEDMTSELVEAFHAAASALLAATDDLAAVAGRRLARLAQSAAAEREATATLLAEHGLSDPETLHQAEIAAATAWEVADRDARRFQAETPVAADLDAGIAAASAALAELRAVARALTSAQFVDYVIGRRSSALLQVSSVLLSQLTAGAYGFAEDFRIVDRQTSTERDVRTLSGGETFLASLALALGLVELAGRGGGRIDSLFLDEGFGSLDATLLPDALDVLRSHVSASRLVGVISHLHSVAADLDRVLLVTRQVHGSHTRWLDPAERERLLADEVSAGLLR
jgi:exonuclease SbcC